MSVVIYGNESAHLVKSKNPQNKTLVVSFGGFARKNDGVITFEFRNFLNHSFPTISKHFYVDLHSHCYHKGLRGITRNVDETLEWLRNTTKGHEKIVFIGNSSGSYAALLFGSLLNVSAVLCFQPITVIDKLCLDTRYKDVRPFMEENNVKGGRTRYYLHGSLKFSSNDIHHIGQCERVSDLENVFLVKHHQIDLREMRNSGDLFKIIQDILSSV